MDSLWPLLWSLLGLWIPTGQWAVSLWDELPVFSELSFGWSDKRCCPCLWEMLHRWNPRSLTVVCLKVHVYTLATDRFSDPWMLPRCDSKCRCYSLPVVCLSGFSIQSHDTYAELSDSIDHKGTRWPSHNSSRCGFEIPRHYYSASRQ